MFLLYSYVLCHGAPNPTNWKRILKKHISVHVATSLQLLWLKRWERGRNCLFFFPFKENNLKVQWYLGDRSQLITLKKNTISNGMQGEIFLLLNIGSMFKISIKRQCVGRTLACGPIQWYTEAASTKQQEPGVIFSGIRTTGF